MTALRMKYLTLAATQRFVTEDCLSCGDVFAMSEQTYQKRMADKRSFYCPGCGKSMSYTGKTRTQQLEEELAAARSLAERESRRRHEAEAGRAAARGEVLRLRTRIGNGVCPCCNRTFPNLGEHMAGQHPDWRIEEYEPNPGITFDRLTDNQKDHVRRIGRLIDRDDDQMPGLPLDWGHRSTIRALETRGVVTIEHHVDSDDYEYDAAVPTLTGLRLIAAAGGA